MMNVARWAPKYVLPYIDFSPQTPYASQTAWSSSASSVKLRFWPSWNFFTRLTGSGETPRTRTPASV